jgi:hypothetical protein
MRVLVFQIPFQRPNNCLLLAGCSLLNSPLQGDELPGDVKPKPRSSKMLVGIINHLLIGPGQSLQLPFYQHESLDDQITPPFDKLT